MIDKIVANQWMLELVFVVFCVVAVLIIEIIKKIIQTAVKKRGGTFDKKKYEYVFSLAAFTIASTESFVISPRIISNGISPHLTYLRHFYQSSFHRNTH